jgi:hypothetical protein
MISCDGCGKLLHLPFSGTYQPARGPAVDCALCARCAKRLRLNDRRFVELLEARLLLWAKHQRTEA